MSVPADHPDEPLTAELDRLRAELLSLETELRARLAEVPPGRAGSGLNLVHYVALRRHDVRTLQERLARRGLSSLGRCEPHVLATLDAVRARLGVGDAPPADAFDHGPRTLADRAEALFGAGPGRAAVMVTAPSEAAEDAALVRGLLDAGTDVLRINCAHDDAGRWAAMASHARTAAAAGRPLRIAMDLGGPKIRTGPLEPGPRVFSWRPERDAYGRPVRPAVVTFTREPAAASDGVTIHCDSVWWEHVRPGDQLRLRDARGADRRLEVTAVDSERLESVCSQTTYVTPETEVTAAGPDAPSFLPFATIDPKPGRAVLRRGDILRLTDPSVPGHGPSVGPDGSAIPASIGCTAPEVFADLRVGERVLIDDGKLAGVIREAGPEPLVEIIVAPPNGRRLRPDKGLNFPDTDLRLPALTAKDRADLASVVAFADIVNFSFVRRPEDLAELDAELARHGRPDLPVILKIENRQAFENLPRLLLATLSRAGESGVMIARGDLAAECGWERLVEVQEQILCLCEAAHLPVVWATQVLEGLAKGGVPTRAEVTDAGVAARAECVMLNKGPNIVAALHAVRDIADRMRGHQQKKRPTFRQLRMADGFGPPGPNEPTPA